LDVVVVDEKERKRQSTRETKLCLSSFLQDTIAELITREQGKTIADARGDVFRGLEVVEHACSVGSLQMGETAENVTKNMDTYSYRQPLGVCAGICPFNFPGKKTDVD
jgi:acyl-CoA reductase-like NAD-dependent aldehyde dehydrogenase